MTAQLRTRCVSHRLSQGPGTFIAALNAAHRTKSVISRTASMATLHHLSYSLRGIIKGCSSHAYACMNQTYSRSCDSSSMHTALFNLYPGWNLVKQIKKVESQHRLDFTISRLFFVLGCLLKTFLFALWWTSEMSLEGQSSWLTPALCSLILCPKKLSNFEFVHTMRLEDASRPWLYNIQLPE